MTSLQLSEFLNLLLRRILTDLLITSSADEGILLISRVFASTQGEKMSAFASFASIVSPNTCSALSEM